jgi:hypothetical protein
MSMFAFAESIADAQCMSDRHFSSKASMWMSS